MAEARPLPNGTELNGRYRILQRLNSGGFGITYLAHSHSNTQVVLKEYFPPWFATRNEGSKDVLPNAGSEEDFRRYYKLFEVEAKQLAAMRHDNIVSLSGAFRENNTAYYAMPFIGGGSLSQAIKAMRTEGAWPSQITVLFILRSLLNALEHMHSCELQGKPIYHLDIKPGNILLTDNGNQSSPVFIDLGSANMGTPGFMPHEQCENDGAAICPATDLFALGATLFMLLTGRKPEPHVDKDNHVVAPPRQHCLAKDETLLERYDEELLASIDKSLAWEPSDRFSCAHEWLEAIKGVTIRFSDNGISIDRMVYLIKTAANRSVPTKSSAPKKQISVKKAPVAKHATNANSGQGGLIMIFSLTLALLLAGAAAFYYFSDTCRISEEEKLKANYKDRTYRAMSECLCDDCKKHLTRISNEFHTCRISEEEKLKASYKDSTYRAMSECLCDDCQKHLTRISNEFHTCRISDKQKNDAQKDDATYKDMRQCVEVRNCESCARHLARIDEEFKKCRISEEQKQAAQKDDATYKAMQQCVKDRNCVSCEEHLARIDETVEQEAADQAQKEKEEKEAREKACSLSEAQKKQRNTAKKGDKTYKAMKNCLKKTKNKCLPCEIAIRRSDSRAMCPNSVPAACPDEINREDSLHHMKTFLCEDCRAALANLCTVTDETRQKALEGDAAAKDAVQKCADIRNCSDCANTLQQAEGNAAEQTCDNQCQEAPTDDALIACLKKNQCSHCREKLAEQNPALIQCNIDPEKAKTAAKDDETYKAMQTCVAEKQCPACKEHLKRIEDEKRQEQNRACTVGDGGDAESWWNCVVERNCEQCWNKLKENAEQNQKEQADKPKS